MTSWHLTIWELTIRLFQEQKEISKWKKKRFSLLHKCSLLDIQNRLAKMLWTQPLRDGIQANIKTGVSRKQSTPDFPKNENFLPPDTHTYVVRFSGNLACCVFLKHSFWDSPFCLITDEFERRIQLLISLKSSENLWFSNISGGIRYIIDSFQFP